MSFSTSSTRQLTAGDTPDLNDGVLSRLIVDALNLTRGQACYIVDGEITPAEQALCVTAATAMDIEPGEVKAIVDSM